MLELFTFGGAYMIQTLPAPLRWLHPLAGMTYEREGLLAGFHGVPGFAHALTVMIAVTPMTAAGSVLLQRYSLKRRARERKVAQS
ncbi:hypothetical protein D7D52_30020 [Nocardia yunnanensis]|uniref:Uncharacterized protein n=2 Tax=Nocardia yunnanensis TaxID=2382165 RepID=A0A386ZJM4_9NOCA|nr:hypothetical protein D7D52_30020 [Nocardia yunnanensis]